LSFGQLKPIFRAVDLQFVFELEGDRIASLEIG